MNKMPDVIMMMVKKGGSLIVKILGMLLLVVGGAAFAAAIIAEITTGWFQSLEFLPWGFICASGASLIILGNILTFPEKSEVDPLP